MKKLIALFSLLLLLTLVVFGQADTTGTADPVTSAFDWTDFITGLVTLVLGAWAGRTQFADKTGREKAKYKGKLDDVSTLIDDVLRDLRNNTFTKESVRDHLEKGKNIIKGD